MKRNLLLLILSLPLYVLSAQVYVPLDTANFSRRKELSKTYQTESKSFIRDFKESFSGPEKTYIKKQFEEHFKEFSTEIEHGDYVFDPRFDHLVDSIYKKLSGANDEIPKDLRFYISRNISLNASSLGDKTFVINMGAFYFLDNDNELGAVIAHEIGHYMLKHHIESMQRQYKADKVDARSALSTIRSERYNRGAMALERYKSMMYADQSMNRRQEREADSVGYIYYKKAGFKNTDYLNSYRLMALYDTIKEDGVKEGTYRKIFNFKGLAFKDSWLKKEDFSGYDYSRYKSKFNEDSLKSHPETQQRIAYLKTLFPELNDSLAPTRPTHLFKVTEHIARMEQVPSLDYNENYGGGIYMCLLNLQDSISDSYYQRCMGHLFQKIYDARKTYTLNRYLDRVEPKEQSPSYQQFLNFMWNLNLNELKMIAEFYNVASK
ncbi:MAG: hypothetical protein RIS29_1669 [Bacteroidota bacterium]|jgi:hypothetical protein